MVPRSLGGCGGVGGGELIPAVNFGAFRGGDGSVEERAFGLPHPGLEAGAHVPAHALQARTTGEVVRLVRVVEEVVELLGGDGTLRPPVGEHDVLAQAVVYVGDDGGGVLVVEAADVLPAVGAGAALRFVGDVVGLLGEEGVADLLGLAVYERQERLALEPEWSLCTDEIADG